MAVLHEIKIPNILPTVKEELRTLIGREFWFWFHDHQNHKITTVKVWFLKKSLYVKDLKEIFTLLFGTDPTA